MIERKCQVRYMFCVYLRRGKTLFLNLKLKVRDVFYLQNWQEFVNTFTP